MTDTGKLEWHRAAAEDDVPEGSVKTCDLGGRLVALLRHEGRFSALDNRCTHMGGPLGEGTIEYGRLVCPWHGREFDPFTGACDNFPDPVECFPVESRNDGLYVGLPGLKTEPGGS
jgi:nitrite reductase/ring-hydroxylating ferredoxin subunit